MSRITTTILVFMLLVNGGVTIMGSSGLSEDLGVTLAPGVNEAMEQTLNNVEEFRTSEGLGDTLFSLFASAGSSFRVIVEGVFSAPTMLMNLGFPDWIVIPMFAPMYLLSAMEMVSVFTGRDMI